MHLSNSGISALSFPPLLLLALAICRVDGQHGQPTRKHQTLRQRMLQASVAKGSGATGSGAKGAGSGGSGMSEGFMTAPQCKCKDIKDCNQQLVDQTNKCRVSPKCETFLKKIGNSAKIRACLAREQADMERLEECVESKVGPIGCTNDSHPKNLTIPIMPMMAKNGGEDCANGSHKRPARSPTEKSRKQNSNNQQQQDVGHAPMEMSDYLMCVDECAMNALNNESKMCTSRQTPLNCAVKLRCTLAPPDERGQRAFEQCERETALPAARRFKSSCECLKAAGVSIQCPK